MELNNVYITLDGCSNNTNHLYYLNALKQMYNNFKCTIFVPLLLNEVSFVEQMNNTGFLEVACFGFYGRGREFERFTEQQFNNKIDEIEEKFTNKYIKGIKAPQFAYTSISYDTIRNRNYWLIENQYNKSSVPSGIRYFKYKKLNDSFYFDGHASNNAKDKRGIDQSFTNIVNSLNAIDNKDFKYVSESIIE